MSADFFVHSSFLQAINAEMLWLVHVFKVLQASEHLCPAKLQTRCAMCCACQSICPFIPTDSGVPRTVDPQQYLQPKTVHDCVPVGASQPGWERHARNNRCYFCQAQPPPPPHPPTPPLPLRLAPSIPRTHEGLFNGRVIPLTNLVITIL